MKRADDPYAVLGVSEDATDAEIRAAWRFAIEAFHPDRHSGDEQRRRAHDMATRVNAAWDILSDPRRRRDHDARRETGTTPVEPRHDGPIIREIPCPMCLSRCGVPDQAGRAVQVRCPSCSSSFRAYVGATLVGRPQLVVKWLRGWHILRLGARGGGLSEVIAHRLPAELQLIDGELVTVVMDAAKNRARYLIVHGERTDIGWKVG